ncbi:TolC family protein [Chitinophaga pinensis]|uniref:Outer membrane efflux protein n=1 Tax=Chitinophaga pinensis (strain ATCC 43595 / DSM 2588 / LMG 13176 / NBRC 15968 / NCIMB 11800 / UQM 2034) TaxID=485918 RepID=A0A979FZ80_CHIPD|nr:TolC family protein [Chitinophaga pinensis]ACU57865.1 outer membrane efflux protein [Chitinophaga pinensis DSM 2588]
MKRTLLYLSLLLCSAAHAQQILTPEQAIDVALKNNYDIRLAKSDAAITANDYAYANLAFAPRVNGTANKVWNATQTKQEFANGSKRDTSGIRASTLSANVSLAWTLFDGLKMFATRQKLESLRDLGELAVKDQVINTVANVIAGYYNVVQQKQQLRNLSEQLSISEERVKLSDAKFQTGLGPKTDWLQSKVDYNALKASYLRQQTLIEQSKATLNQLMAVEAGNTQYDVMDTIPLNMDLSYGGLRQQALEKNTGIKVAQQNLTVSQLQLKESKGDYFPVINFNSAYNYSRVNSNAATNSFSPVYNQNGVVSYGFSATIPIFNGLNVRRQVNAAKLNVNYQQLALDNTRTIVDLSLISAFKDYEYYKTAVTLEDENLGLARENVMVAMERFRQGVSTVIEMKEAQQSLEDAYNRLINARYNIKLAETQLLRLNGMLVK